MFCSKIDNVSICSKFVKHWNFIAEVNFIYDFKLIDGTFRYDCYWNILRVDCIFVKNDAKLTAVSENFAGVFGNSFDQLLFWDINLLGLQHVEFSHFFACRKCM